MKHKSSSWQLYNSQVFVLISKNWHIQFKWIQTISLMLQIENCFVVQLRTKYSHITKNNNLSDLLVEASVWRPNHDKVKLAIDNILTA